MTPLPPADRPDWLAYITRTPALLDVLWDLDVMPEQVTAGSHEDETMLRIAAVWSLAAAAEREACAVLSESFGDGEDGIQTTIQCDIAAAIRARS